MISKMKKMICVCAVIISGWWLFSCTLELSADSPGDRAVTLAAGMPAGLTVYEPRITYDGATFTLIYDVKADFSQVIYTAQRTTAASDEAEPQSIEALLWGYSELFSPSITGTKAGGKYAETKKEKDYVIIPLEISRIKEYFGKEYPKNDTDSEDFPKLVWIEENPALTGDKVVWKNGTYEDTGIRISGLAESGEEVTISGTIDDFDDGKEGRIPSIATVLADGEDRGVRYTSTIHFYTGIYADAIRTGVSADEDLENAEKVRKWIKNKDNKPALRVVYQWVD